VFAEKTLAGTVEHRKTDIIQASQASLIALVNVARHGWNRSESMADGAWRGTAR